MLPARTALAEDPAWTSVGRALAARLAEPHAPPAMAVAALAPLEGAGAVGAVDGGSALVLEGNGLAVGAVRAAALAWRAHVPLREDPARLELRVLDAALAGELRERLPGLPPDDRPAVLLERLRALREWEAAMGLAAALGEGDVLCVDGPLAQRDWTGGMLRALAEACGPRGVGLAGVCKSASATLDGVPALLAAGRAARRVPEPWTAPLPSAGPVRSHAVRWLRGAPVFRVEMLPGSDPQEMLGRLAPWTRDAGYPGYPYPLALAHNRCALDDALAADLAARVRGAALGAGADPRAWDAVFEDFHEVLDRGR